MPPVTISQRSTSTNIEHIFSNRGASMKVVQEGHVVALALTCPLDENRVKHRGRATRWRVATVNRSSSARLFAIAAVNVLGFAVSRCPEGTRNLRNLQLDFKVCKTQCQDETLCKSKSANKCRSCRETITSRGLHICGAFDQSTVDATQPHCGKVQCGIPIIDAACHWIKDI